LNGIYYGPLSTSKQKIVAAEDAGKDGIVLFIEPLDQSDYIVLDVSAYSIYLNRHQKYGISKHTDEAEVLLLDQNIKITDIVTAEDIVYKNLRIKI